MADFLPSTALVAWGVDWLHANLLSMLIAEQAVVVVLLAGLFALYAGPLKRFLGAQVARLPPGTAQHILVPLSHAAPWFVLLLTLWFAVTVFAAAGLLTGLLRLAENLVLAWLVIRLISRLVQHETYARALAVLAFAVVALNLAGLLPRVLELLDAMAVYIGALRISVLVLLKGAITLAVALWIAGTIARVAENRLGHFQPLTPAMQVLTSKLIRFTLLSLAVLFALGSVGIDLTAFAVFSGAVGVGIGFGLQKVVSNLVSGVILLLDRSIKPGDVIEIDGGYGWITGLNARYVSLATRDGREILIPNETLITEKVTNWSFSNNLVRQHVGFGIAYDSDVHLAIKVALQAVDQVERALKEPKPVCLLKEFADSAVNLELRFWIHDPANGTANVRSQVMLHVWDLFHAHGIEFPFPQRDLTLRNPEALAAALRAGSGSAADFPAGS